MIHSFDITYLPTYPETSLSKPTRTIIATPTTTSVPLTSCGSVSGHSVKEKAFKRCDPRTVLSPSADRQTVFQVVQPPSATYLPCDPSTASLRTACSTLGRYSRGISRPSKCRESLIRAFLADCTPCTPVLDTPCPTVTPNKSCSERSGWNRSHRHSLPPRTTVPY